MAVCLGNTEKGVFLNESPEIWGVFQKLPEKLRKGRYDLCVHVSRAFNSLPRKGDRALIAYAVGPLEGSGIIRTHISRARRK